MTNNPLNQYAYLKMACDGSLSLDMLEYFMKDGDLHPEQALAYTAEKGHALVFEKVISLYQPTPEHFDQAWHCIITGGNLDIVKTAWPHLSEASKNNYLNACFRHKDTTVIRFLHSQNPIEDVSVLSDTIFGYFHSWEKGLNDDVLVFVIEHMPFSVAYAIHQQFAGPHEYNKNFELWIKIQERACAFEQKKILKEVVNTSDTLTTKISLKKKI